jgi:hypothetical protein
VVVAGHGRAGTGAIKEGDPSVVLLLDHDLKGLANQTIKVTGGPSYERFTHCIPLHQRGRAQSDLSQHVPQKVKLPFSYLLSVSRVGARFARTWTCSE